MEIKVRRTPNSDPNLALPGYASEHAAGADIRANLPDGARQFAPGERGLIPTGLCFEIPTGYEIQVRPRSGLALKQGLALVNSPGTIDADYRGEVGVIVINLSQEAITISHGDRIAQIVVAPVVQADFTIVESLSDTTRGEGGFGSTGVDD